MTSKSKAQRRAAGIELQRRRKGLPPRYFRQLSDEKLREFAETKERGLPQHLADG